MKKNDVIIRALVPAELKTAFDAVCDQEDLSASQVLRAMMRDYVRKHAQPELALKPKAGKK